MINRLESRSSVTGVGCPKLPMKGIVGRCFLIVDSYTNAKPNAVQELPAAKRNDHTAGDY